MKKYSGKMMGVLLAISMTVTAVFPVRSTAAESNDVYGSEMEQASLTENEVVDGMLAEGQMLADEPETDEKDGEAELADDAKESGDTQTNETVQMPEESQPTDNVQEDEGKQDSDGQLQEGVEAAGDGQIFEGEEAAGEDAIPEEMEEESEITGDELGQEDTGESDDKQPQNTEEGIMSVAENYDINQPVIESFEFAENGQALTWDDTLHFTVSAYDADSGISMVEIIIFTTGNCWNYSCTKDGDGNLYNGIISCSELPIFSDSCWAGVRVTDNVGNYVELGADDTGWQFTMENTVEVSISDIQMQISDANGDGKLSVNDKVTYTADIVCTGGSITNIYMQMHINGGSEWSGFEADYDANTHKATGIYTITEKTYPGIWDLFEICVNTESRSYNFYSSDVSPDVDLKFEVEQEDYDTEKPVIESIVIDKNGQYVKEGDVITITVKATDAHLPSEIWAYFSPAASWVSVSNNIMLSLDESTGEYVGTITITDDTYPCEWYLSSLILWDEAGNPAYLHDFQSDYYSTYPWYYRVKAGNTYVENVKDVTFSFYGWTKQQDSDGYYQGFISEETVKNVGRRASLKDLGVALPQAPIEGLEIIGWMWYDSLLIDENSQFLFDYYGDHITLTACYSNCVVVLNYPDGTCEYFIMDKGAQFTLPTDKDKYINIVWSDYDMGATVVVSEDMNFYVTDWEIEDDMDNQGSENESGTGTEGTEDGTGTEGSENGTGTEGTENGTGTEGTGNGTGTEGTGNGTGTEGTENSTGTEGTENSTGTVGSENSAGTEGTENSAGAAEIKLSERRIAEITAEIENAANDATITVDMEKATVVPKQILESVRGKSVDVVLKMNGYSWVINGKDVTATNLKEINLEVKLDVDAVPTSLVKSLAGDNPARQLSLTHNGDFGFRASLILDLGIEHSGETGNLYYYDSTGKLVFVDAGEIEKDGTVSLTFSHASDYVVIIDSNAVAKETRTDMNSRERKSPKTGE